MAFKTFQGGQQAPDTPEALFRDLRGRSVQGLLSQQADVLRAYADTGVGEADVALQLPTGSGKTLVGLLIAEWRRRKFRERAVYLCPTRQLVNQVAESSGAKYGIRVHALAGSKREFDPAAAAEYRTADAVAVTTYSALFNTNPFFESPQTIVVDDAHAAENYIADMWSLRIVRSTHEPFFRSFISALQGCFTETDHQRLLSGNEEHWDATWIEMVPVPKLVPIAPRIEALLDEHCVDGDHPYAWSCLKGRLAACNVFVSPREILIRPLVPPTFTHAPFADARHRIYMSATLGAGGDLERITGRRNIHRVRPPQGYERQGVGRRLFLFPGRSLEEEATQDLVNEVAAKSGRALYLVPSEARAVQVRKWLAPSPDTKWFDGPALEKSKTPFVNAKRAVALVANRYDGIDLLGDECRLLVVDGFPRTTNLQEQFLMSRMAAGVLLDERIGTRLAQGFGRCTRSDTDFAVVVIVGDDLSNHLMHADRRAHFHPELQAEIEFGLEQSRELKAEAFLDNARIFLAQKNEWQVAEAELIARRDALTKTPRPGEVDLERSVHSEIEYAEALWSGDLAGALGSAESVLGELKADSLRGYRALWDYLAGCCAWQLSHLGRPGMLDRANEHFRRAASAAVGVRWLHGLATDLARGQDVSRPYQQAQQEVIGRLESQLLRLGLQHDRKFEQEIAEVMKGLLAAASPGFELAHVQLGRLLGYDVGGEIEDGAPDAWWRAGEMLSLVFEDHAGAVQTSSLSVTKMRQAASHEGWVRDRLKLPDAAVVVPVLVSPCTAIDRAATPHGKDVRYWNLDEFRLWVQRAVEVLRAVRPLFPGRPDLAWQGDAIGRQRGAGVDLASLIETLDRKRVASLSIR